MQSILALVVQQVLIECSFPGTHGKLPCRLLPPMRCSRILRSAEYMIRSAPFHTVPHVRTNVTKQCAGIGALNLYYVVDTLQHAWTSANKVSALSWWLYLLCWLELLIMGLWMCSKERLGCLEREVLEDRGDLVACTSSTTCALPQLPNHVKPVCLGAVHSQSPSLQSMLFLDC